ncbi:hypothetical protein HWV62_15921 [Athelia sp. TMB]|nr:hypothetical protein HWV62_15921 [Athelia sp. TMB]
MDNRTPRKSTRSVPMSPSSASAPVTRPPTTPHHALRPLRNPYLTLSEQRVICLDINGEEEPPEDSPSPPTSPSPSPPPSPSPSPPPSPHRICPAQTTPSNVTADSTRQPTGQLNPVQYRRVVIPPYILAGSSSSNQTTHSVQLPRDEDAKREKPPASPPSIPSSSDSAYRRAKREGKRPEYPRDSLSPKPEPLAKRQANKATKRPTHRNPSASYTDHEYDMLVATVKLTTDDSA